MVGKPMVVAILAGMVVAMIGVVLMQRAPEGFVISSLLRVGPDDQEVLEEQLRREAAQLAADKEKSIDPHSLSVVKSGNQGDGAGVVVAVQAQGANSQSAIDYLNELLVRYARRKGKIEESVNTKLEIADSERKLAAAVKEKQVTTARIEAGEREIKQLRAKEQLEAQQVAKVAPEPAPSVPPPQIDAPVVPASPPEISKAPRQAANEAPRVEEEPRIRDVPTVEAPRPVSSQRRTVTETESSVMAPKAQAPEVEEDERPISEEERLELGDAMKYLKTERLKLLNGGRRAGHPAVLDLDRQIQEIQMKLQPKQKSTGASENRKVQFEYVSSQGRQPVTQTTTRQRRIKLEADVAALKKRRDQALATEASQKAKLAMLVKKHIALDAEFKPVILSPAKVMTTIESPFPFAKLIGTICGAVIAGSMGYVLAKFAERPRTLASISEAEMVLRMPVQTLERAVVRRRAA